MKTLITALKIFLFFTILTGVIYPLLITGIAQVTYPSKANGSLIFKDNKIIGSRLIGQQFDTAIYFSSRPSAIAYNPLPSGGSNFGLTNEKLKIQVADRKTHFWRFNHLDSLKTTIPSEMLFASASGLDPHISLQSAMLQINRIALARKFNGIQKKKIVQCVQKHTEEPQFLCFGEQRVNALLLNIALDKIK